MTTSSQYTDQLRSIYILLESNIKSNKIKIQSQHKIFSDLYRIFVKHASKLASVANSITEEVQNAVNQEELILQYYQMLSSSLNRLAECSRKVSLRMKSEVLEPLKTFNQNYESVSEGIRKQFQSKIYLLNAQDLQMSRCRQSYTQACQKFEKHRQMQKKVMEKNEAKNKNELEKLSQATKKLTENMTDSQKFYLSAVEKSNLQFQNLRRQFGIVSQTISRNQDSKYSFLKKTIMNSVKTFQEFSAAYDPANVARLEEICKNKANKFEDFEVKKLRNLLQKTLNSDFKQRFLGYEESSNGKKKSSYEEDTTHLNDYFSKLKEKQKKMLSELVQPWFIHTNSSHKKNDIISPIKNDEPSPRRKNKYSIINSYSRQRSNSKSNGTERQTQEQDLCKQKILSSLSHSLYFIEVLYAKVLEQTSLYCKIGQENFQFLLNAFCIITRNMDSNSQVGIELIYKMMIISQKIMLKKASISKNGNQNTEFLCHKYGKIVDKFRDPNFLSNLLSYIQKRKKSKKKSNSEIKGSFAMAKDFITSFARGKGRNLNQDQQYDCLHEMIEIIANFSVPNQVILPFIKEAVTKLSQNSENLPQTSYQQLKIIILTKKDIEERHSLFYRREIKEKKEQLLKKAIQTKKKAQYALKIVAQSGFLSKKSITLRAVCKQLKDVHLQILGKIPMPIEQKWLRLIPINKSLNYIAMKREVAENDVPIAVEEIIIMDVNRSLRIHQKVLNPVILQSLLRIYAYFHQDISYCQGMNYIAGYIYIKTKDEESTYRIFQYLMEIRFKEVFANQFQVLKIKMYQFQRLLAIFHPDLSEYFRKQQISPQCYIVSWIITLFASTYQYTRQSFLIDFLWQRFIIWGWPEFFRFVLWIFSLHKQQLIQLTYDNALHFLGELAKSEIFLSGQQKFKQKFLVNMEHPRVGVEKYPVSQQLLNKFTNEYKLDF